VCKYGILATKTIIIPYNKSATCCVTWNLFPLFGLSQIEIFTAGGSSSEIQGIEKNKPKTSNNC
jgi:membrane protein YdbS with pleckstrin-like domain